MTEATTTLTRAGTPPAALPQGLEQAWFYLPDAVRAVPRPENGGADTAIGFQVVE